MRELKRNRKFEGKLENDFDDVSYYDGYTKFTIPEVRGNQYNPMIASEREQLFNNVLVSIDKKQTSPEYDDLFVVAGKNIDATGGVEYRGMLNHSDDDYTKVNIVCELRDKKSGKTLESFDKDLFLNYYDFMDSYDIESDIEDYILDELNKYMVSTLAQHDNEYKNENITMVKSKRSRVNENVSNVIGMYDEANDLFYKALAKYRSARRAAIDDGLDSKIIDSLTIMINKFSDAGNKLVNNGVKFFDWSDWDVRYN